MSAARSTLFFRQVLTKSAKANRTHVLASPRAALLAAVAILVATGLARPARAQNAPLPSYLYDVVRYNAPFIIAESSNRSSFPNHRVDQILPVDFDGDEVTYNNEANANASAYPLWDTRPTVYFSVAESQSWYYIGYYFYHPYDGGFTVDVLATDPGHESDLEGVFFIVQKGLWGPYGEPLFALTQAHGAMVPFGWNQDAGYTMNNSLVTGDAHAYAGEMHFWNNPFSGHDHPVVAVRSSTHGTYMAQDCSDGGQTSYFYDGSGMWGPKSDPYTYRACWHDDSQWMLLEPAFGYDQNQVASFGPYDQTGVWDYRLVDLSTSPVWAYRLSSTIHGRGMFYGTPQDIGGGQQALPHFDSQNYDDSNTADGMWAWVGGGGSCHWYAGVGGCWYTFHDDATNNFHRPATWPGLTPGELLTDPASVARNFFPKFSSFSDAMLYNPYPVNPPPPPPPPQPNVSISGPTSILAGKTGTWQAVVSGGTPPYQYQWSGPFSGTAQSISGQLYSDDILYLDVTDAAGVHVALSYYITVGSGSGCQAPNPC